MLRPQNDSYGLSASLCRRLHRQHECCQSILTTGVANVVMLRKSCSATACYDPVMACGKFRVSSLINILMTHPEVAGRSNSELARETRFEPTGTSNTANKPGSWRGTRSEKMRDVLGQCQRRGRHYMNEQERQSARTTCIPKFIDLCDPALRAEAL